MPPLIKHPPAEADQPSARRSSRAGWIAAAIVAVVGIAAVLVVALAKGGTTTPPKKVAPPAPPGIVLPASSDFVQWLRKQNEWTTERDVPVQYWAVRRSEYDRYVQTLPPEQARVAKALYVPDATAPDQPITWVTWEQADRYCRTIGGKLLSNERWEQTLAGDNGLNPAGVRLWTATKRPNGKAIVRGAFAELPMDRADNRSPWSQEWDTEASAGGRDPIEKVASRQIGFRCTR